MKAASPLILHINVEEWRRLLAIWLFQFLLLSTGQGELCFPCSLERGTVHITWCFEDRDRDKVITGNALSRVTNQSTVLLNVSEKPQTRLSAEQSFLSLSFFLTVSRLSVLLPVWAPGFFLRLLLSGEGFRSIQSRITWTLLESNKARSCWLNNLLLHSTKINLVPLSRVTCLPRQWVNDND